jgi:hypothetical protein
MQLPQQPVFHAAPPFQQAHVYQQHPSFFPQPYGQSGGSFQQTAIATAFQQPLAPAQNAAAKNKRKKKKNVASSSSQSVPPPQMPFAQS